MKIFMFATGYSVHKISHYLWRKHQDAVMTKLRNEV